MKRLSLFLLVMTMTGAGISYAETNNPIQNFFLGNQQLSGAGFNQVLSLLVGPKGQPGPAGVSGRDGAAGLNGSDGAPGPQGPQGVAGAVGAQGPQGLPGQSPVTVQLAVGSTNCPNGGTQITDGSGLITYVCNGARGLAGPSGPSGATGATGATGAQGPAGTGGGGTSINGTGQISLAACDSNIIVAFRSIFVSDGFMLRQINMSDLDEACNGRTISVSFPILQSAPPSGSNPNRPYSFEAGVARDYVDCQMDVPLSGLVGGDNTIVLGTTTPVVVEGGNQAFTLSCSLRRSPGTSINFSDLYTADIDVNIGFQIGS